MYRCRILACCYERFPCSFCLPVISNKTKNKLLKLTHFYCMLWTGHETNRFPILCTGFYRHDNVYYLVSMIKHWFSRKLKHFIDFMWTKIIKISPFTIVISFFDGIRPLKEEKKEVEEEKCQFEIISAIGGHNCVWQSNFKLKWSA